MLISKHINDAIIATCAAEPQKHQRHLLQPFPGRFLGVTHANSSDHLPGPKVNCNAM
jgi:hypothetical protein